MSPFARLAHWPHKTDSNLAFTPARALLPLRPPCVTVHRTDIEYKYLVVWDDGNVVRWQDGPNNKLSVQHPGVLMQVQDTWSQQERSVREVGPRLNRNQHNKQAGGHTSPAAAAPAGGGSGALTQAAAADQPADASAPRISSGISDSSSAAAAAAAAAAVTVLPVQPAWGGVLQSHSLLLDAYDPAAAAAEQDEDHLQYEAAIEEEEDQQWPAKILQKAAAAGQPLACSVPSPASAAPQQAAAPTSAHAPGHSHTHAHTHGKHTQLQQQQAAAANLAELLPLLHTELQSALEELAKHPEAAQEHGGLLSEGQTVLAALQQQVATQGTGTSSTAASGSRSPARSPSATLTSGDEIAAALLSDDCEEACFCMVDAICSCSDWDLNCTCEEDPDTPCELADGDDEAAVPAVHQPAGVPGAAPARHGPAHASATHAAGSAAPAGDWSSTAPSAISVAELARAAAIAATHDPAALAARAAVFTDVQEALEKSAQLLLALSDPCHPLVLEADRSLATASRQLHSGHLLN